jgi:hypothetical protein
MPLQRMIGNIYSVFIEILLWLIPISCIVIGIIGATEFYLFNENAFVGFILGLIAGLLIDVICFGPIIVLLNMRSSLKDIEKKGV